MMFNKSGKYIPKINTSLIENHEYMKRPSNVCKGKCVQYRASKPVGKGRYAAGQFRCQTCEIFMTKDGVDGFSCKCCHMRVRSKPRNSQYKEKFHSRTNSHLNPSFHSTDDRNSEPDKELEVTIDSESQKKSTPIFEEIDETVKTYYEFNDFLKNIKPQANYQLVVLKELLEYGKLNQGQICESLAYFNNKNTQDFDVVKNFFKVPVFDVLLKHGFIKKDNNSFIPKYSLNVKLSQHQKLHLLYYLTEQIEIYNEKHGIPQNQFPEANNMGNFNWTFSDIKNITQNEENNSEKEIKQNSFWIWSVTPDNWEIVKSKNVWGSRVTKEKISKVVKSGDQVAFYVIGSNSFKGIYEFVGDWYDSPGVTWDDDLEPTGELRHKSQIDIKPISQGLALLSELHEKMEIFQNKPLHLRNLVLQGGSGYPSNNQTPLTAKDFEILKEHLSQNPMIPEPVEEKKIIKICPKCNETKVEELPGIKFETKIEELFGYRQSDSDPQSKRPQSYCRKCRSSQNITIETQKEETIENEIQNNETLKFFDFDGEHLAIKQCKVEKTDVIKRGQTLTNDEIVSIFGVGNMGGIRYSTKNNLIVLCDTKSGHYNDKIDKDFGMIYYTGEGQKGDQTLTGRNQRIANSENTPIFYFIEIPQEPGVRKRGPLDNIYNFVGRVKYKKHAFRTESDIDGLNRQVIKFLLEVQHEN